MIKLDNDDRILFKDASTREKAEYEEHAENLLKMREALGEETIQNMLSPPIYEIGVKYQLWLEEQTENKDDIPTVANIVSSMNEENQEDILTLVEAIYLAFPGHEPNKIPAVHPYDPTNELEAAAASAYYKYVHDVHGTERKYIVQIKEAMACFAQHTYKKGEFPVAFYAMDELGTVFLRRIKWQPELWMVEALQKKAKTILDNYKETV